ELAMPLLITGTLDAYRQRHGELHAERMLHFFALDAENPASLYNCLAAARANAHAVRGRITADMWENINASWLEMRGIAEQGLGRFVECADNTPRLLDARYELMGEEGENPDDRSARAYYQWSAVLRALSSHEAFSALYRGSPGVAKVADLLLLRAEVPRSLRACTDSILQILSSLPGETGRPAQRLAAELSARLRYTVISEVL